jgi:hypothetical protein
LAVKPQTAKRLPRFLGLMRSRQRHAKHHNGFLVAAKCGQDFAAHKQSLSIVRQKRSGNLCIPQRLFKLSGH